MDDDYIIYSDSDEIPNPALLKEINLKKKYGIFLQDFYVYNFDTFNHYETPWDGSKICKKRNLKSITYLRKKIKSSNLKKSLWKIFIPKSIQLKTFQHTEFADEKFSNVEVIKDKIQKLIDLFERGHRYKKIKNNKKIPQKILNLYNNIKKNTE